MLTRQNDAAFIHHPNRHCIKTHHQRSGSRRTSRFWKCTVLHAILTKLKPRRTVFGHVLAVVAALLPPPVNLEMISSCWSSARTFAAHAQHAYSSRTHHIQHGGTSTQAVNIATFAGGFTPL